MKNIDGILKTAIFRYGALNQCDMMMEESAELIQAINKFKRKGGIKTERIIKPTFDSPNDYVLAYHALCGEVADVRIMLKQMEFMLDKATIDLIEERKILRLEERLKK